MTKIEKKIQAIEAENAAMRKQLKAVPKSEDFVLGKKVLTEKEVMEHLWKRCKNLESPEYWWFKQMSRVVTVFGKDLSPKQKESMLPIWKKYRDSKETPKGKEKK